MRRLESNKTIEEIAQEGIDNTKKIVKIANGYQPKSAPKTLLAPPKGGSNAIKESIKVEVEVKDWIDLHKEHAQEIIKVSEEEYSKGYFDGVKKAVTLLYNSLFSKENTDNYDFEAWGIVHIYEDDFKEFVKNELGVEVE